MAKKNIFVFIHGIVLERQASSNALMYRDFRNRLTAVEPSLEPEMIDPNCVFVEYNHATLNTNPRTPGPDQNLTQAEETVYNRVNYESVRNSQNPYDVIQPDTTGGGIFGVAAAGLRILTTQLRENILIRGMGDAVYYCSEEGERAVRQTVYGQILKKLDEFVNDEITLHIIAHSLGTTVAHDFLFGLFGPKKRWDAKKPDFVSDEEFGVKYEQWREQAAAGKLKLGSMCSMASQIPLLILRRQAVVDTLKENKFLDPKDLGIKADGKIQWKLFYDIDDLLAFPTRRIYKGVQTIMDIQVDSGDDPASAHSGYWETREVIHHTAEMIRLNL